MKTQQQAITARGLVKSFGAVKAVAGVDLDLAEGEAVGLLGPNGAGKSTALSMLMGLRKPDAGSVSIFGHAAGSRAARRVTGVTPQAAGFPVQLTPREVLAYAAAHHANPRQSRDLAEAFGVGALMDRRMVGFSGGEVRRVALALAFVGAPKLVFLDEPTTGLDTAAQEGFCSVARAFVQQGGALVLTSHHWDEIEAICDRITMIDKGERVLDGSLDEIRARTRVNRLSFALPDGVMPPDWLGATHSLEGWHVETRDSDGVLRRMVAEGVPFAALSIQPLALKDVIARIRMEATQ
ncbi:ABC transporter ATP-binding protein [Pararhodobacter sp.]|uniref:ABC transporter ATP-binding protein n=1 Tax=Pararhodobacter sp. TaxID=2127056 RepID=UPI002AFDDE18|nr:ABC transporter ATP-binding protein [Pararhodobacter sp.]